jgi:transposase-like protein
VRAQIHNAQIARSLANRTRGEQVENARGTGDLAGSTIAPTRPDSELRMIVYTTNAVESLNARLRKAVRHRGHFPNDHSALKVLYLVATERRPNRSNPTGRINAWKSILNALTIHYGDRIQAAS